jgi:hypothetical protein
MGTLDNRTAIVTGAGQGTTSSGPRATSAASRRSKAPLPTATHGPGSGLR